MFRARLSIIGVVQGVGFRPFAWRRATRLGLSGFVANTSAGVVVEVQGPAGAVAAFGTGLAAAAPPLAAIERVAVDPIPAVADEPAGRFLILASTTADGPAALAPADLAACDECLAELRDPVNRRHGHPFVSCTACGPRFTIIERLPYDRGATTLRGFPPCPRCAAEHADPADRRFHAESISCPACGPRLWFVAAPAGASAAAASHPDQPDAAAAIAAARRLLAAGGILAVKGPGGFRLACDATSAAAVETLRQRKRRPTKPLAVMVADLGEAGRVAAVDEQAAGLLAGPARPIVLLRKRPAAGLADALALGSRFLGLMLPATPLDNLLAAGLPPLVATSGNLAEEPIAADNAEAIARLGGIADAFLLHDLRIHAPCDDSVVRCVAGMPLPIRRSRGHAPLPVRLADTGPPVLAVGGELKAAFCLVAGDRAILSQHLGDVGSLETLAAVERAAEHLLSLCAVEPAAVAADLHPGYLSAEWAARFAAARDLPLVRVPHHEAHVAALLAEHHGGPHPPAPCLVACFDGTGYRPDGVVAGGEFFLADAAGIRHVARLLPFPLPGGDAAIRHPWRTALAVLHAAGIPWDDRLPAVSSAEPAARGLLARQLDRGLACPRTTSMGRLFDAVATICGGPASITFEAEAALVLESWADDDPGGADRGYAFDLVAAAPPADVLEIDWRPVVAAVVRDRLTGVPVGRIAAGFHDAVARLVEAVRRRLGAPAAVGLTGGVFQNAVLVERVLAVLAAAGCEPLLHHAVPPNDGGLALGQAVLARERLAAGSLTPP